MKLVMVTSVAAYQQDVLKLFEQANIENFSSSEIDGHKQKTSILNASDWFSGQKNGTTSSLFFSFTDEEHIASLFLCIEAFNKNLKTKNRIRAFVLPVAQFI